MNSRNATVNISLNSYNVTFIAYNCTRKSAGSFAILLAFISCPVYILIFKILFHDLRLSLPRHKILLSVNISDSIQIAGGALLSIVSFISQTRSNSTGCQVIRKFMEFLGITTVVSASGSILLLSFERYVACVHCLRLHDIVTDNLVHRALYCIWGVAFICGFLDKERYEANYTVVAVVMTKSISIIYTTVVLISTVVLAYVQIRLYLLSHKKNKVQPSIIFGRAEEEKETRKAEMKVAIVASAVVVLYVVCMCPLAFHIISVGFDDQNDASVFRLVSFILLQVNTVANPFVYGFGMADIRQKIITDLRKMKTAVVDFASRIFNL